MQDSDNKGFALYDDVADVVTGDLATNSDINDLFGDFDTAPVDLLSESKDFSPKDEEELSELDLSAGSLDKSNDSVRVYLREMGMVPLLTREGEIELAKRIERGEFAVKKALSRSQLTLNLLIETKARIEQGTLSVLDVLQSPDLPVGQDEEEVVAFPLRDQLLTSLCEIEKLYRKAQAMQQKLMSMSKNFKPKQYRKFRFEYSRLLIIISRQVRKLAFTARYQRSLSAALKRAVEKMRLLEEELSKLQRRLEQAQAGIRIRAGTGDPAGNQRPDGSITGL